MNKATTPSTNMPLTPEQSSLSAPKPHTRKVDFKKEVVIPIWEIMNPDVPLCDDAIRAMASLLIDAIGLGRSDDTSSGAGCHCKRTNHVDRTSASFRRM